jgi:hypothetical protein
MLGERLDAIQAKAEISAFRASGRYEPIPYPVEIEGGVASLDGTTIALQDVRGRVGSSTFFDLTGRLEADEVPYLEMTAGEVMVELEELYAWLSSLEGLKEEMGDLRSLQGSLALSTLEFRGALGNPEAWHFKVGGELRDLSVDAMTLPGRLSVDRGSFEATPERVDLREVQLAFSDASLSLSGAMSHYLEGVPDLDLTIEGSAGPVASQWICDQAGVPRLARPRAPFSVSPVRLVRDGPSAWLTGKLAVGDGLEVSGELLRDQEGLRIKELTVRDAASSASLSLLLSGQTLDVQFQGRLAGPTLDALLEANPFSAGLIQGDGSIHVPLDRPEGAKLTGTWRGEDVLLPWQGRSPVRIDRISLWGGQEEIRLDNAEVRWGDLVLSLSGKVIPSAGGPRLEMDLSTPAIVWEEIQGLMGEEGPMASLPLRGTLRVRSEEFRHGRLVWRPFHAMVAFADEEVKVEVKEAALCGIETPGTLRVGAAGIAMDFRPLAAGQTLDVTLGCLGREDVVATGLFDLKGELKGNAKRGDLLRALRGDLELQATQGRILRHGLLARILALVNVTGVLRGQLPDLTAEAIPYDTMRGKVSVRDGRIAVREWVIDGPSVKVVGQGSVDLVARQMELQLLVSPFRTADFVLEKIPIVGQLTGGSVMAVPIKVAGDLEDPTITPLHPSAVGAGLLGITKRSLQLPLKLLDPFAPGGTK